MKKDYSLRHMSFGLITNSCQTGDLIPSSVNRADAASPVIYMASIS
jgi:hypothetical protein